MFFKMFPYTSYRFGDADELSFTEDLTVYAEVLDTLRVNDSFYVDYYIQHGERADHVAYKLYKNPQLHWTFYLMNPDLRECGCASHGLASARSGEEGSTAYRSKH